MRFTKMQALGNDYIYVNAMEEKIENPSVLAQKLSDRHFGVGGDGLILIDFSEKADVKMRMFNADGTEGEICGNGIRCVAKYVYDKKIVKNKNIKIETYNGIIETKIFQKKYSETILADMGQPSIGEENKKIVMGEEEYTADYISMGNPHGVVFVDSVADIDIEKIGPKFENHPMFPDRVNTEFIELVDDKTIKMRVWERGAGETLACGTGACASAYASYLNKKTGKKVLVHLLGGDLQIEYDEEKDTIFMTGPATTVFDGEIDLTGIDD